MPTVPMGPDQQTTSRGSRAAGQCQPTVAGADRRLARAGRHLEPRQFPRYVPCLLEEQVRSGLVMANDLDLLDDRTGNWMLATQTGLGERDATGRLVMN